MSVEATGFQILTQQKITVAALQTLGWDPKMQIGAASQTITVADTPPELHTEDATLGASMGNETLCGFAAGDERGAARSNAVHRAGPRSQQRQHAGRRSHDRIV